MSPRFEERSPLHKVPLMSPEAAWIIREMLRDRPEPYGSRDDIAVKTGTSSSYRDVWAIGVTDYHTIGVWIGQPDNVSMRGHMGASTAVPLLRSAAQHLPRGDIRAHDKPENVIAETICWPSGQKTSALCDVRREAWTIAGSMPATLMHTAEKRALMSTPSVSYLKAKESGMRVSLGCMDAVEKVTVPVWPAPLQQWIPEAWQTSRRIPPLDPRCDPNHRAFDSAPLYIDGLENGARVKRHQTTQLDPVLKVGAIGGEADWFWFLDGQLLEARSAHITLPLPSPGHHQLLVTDQSGKNDRIEFEIE